MIQVDFLDPILVLRDLLLKLVLNTADLLKGPTSCYGGIENQLITTFHIDTMDPSDPQGFR